MAEPGPVRRRERAGRKAAVREQAGELEGGDGRGGGGLVDALCGGEGGADLVDEEIEGEVERRDSGNDAEGLADGEGHAALAGGGGVHGDDLAGQAMGFLGGKEQGIGGALHFQERFAHRLAAFGADGDCEVAPSAPRSLAEARRRMALRCSRVNARMTGAVRLAASTASSSSLVRRGEDGGKG